jgi:single-stranded DNA-binding protein
MLSALATGQIIRTPKSGISASGVKWANTTIRCPCGQSREGDQETAFINVICFGDQADKLARLDKGDAISAQGALKPTQYEKDGEQRHGLELLAQAILSPYGRRKKRGDPGDQASAKPPPLGPGKTVTLTTR